MKSTLFGLFLLFSTAAFAQSGGNYLSNEPAVVTIPSHPEHAYQHSMQSEQSLLIDGTGVSAKGERPLWEVGAKPAVETPLGDVARLYRDQHVTVKKAVKSLQQ